MGGIVDFVVVSEFVERSDYELDFDDVLARK